MLFLLILMPSVAIAAFVHGLLQAWAPSNILIRHVRASRPTFPMTAALGVVAFACLTAMHLLAEAIESGAPRWLNLAVLVLAWDAIKIGVLACLTAARRGVRPSGSWASTGTLLARTVRRVAT